MYAGQGHSVTGIRGIGDPSGSREAGGPECRITFIGLELDTVVMEIHLPPHKLRELIHLAGWRCSRRTCHRRE